jgi:D-alanyl-D-alanine carboxypeptidase
VSGSSSAITELSPPIAWAAGGIISTATDPADDAESLVGGGLLNADPQRERLDSLAPVDPLVPKGPSYGLPLTNFGLASAR